MAGRSVWFWMMCLFAGPSLAPADEGVGSYLEPRFGAPLFDARTIPLNRAEKRELANHLVSAAYFLNDSRGKSGEALALADAFVPRHSGTRVANFRLRSGEGAAEVKMVVVDELAGVLVRGASRILGQANENRDGLAAAAYLLDIAGALPIEDGALREAMAMLSRTAPEADWGPVYFGEKPAAEGRS